MRAGGSIGTSTPPSTRASTTSSSYIEARHRLFSASTADDTDDRMSYRNGYVKDLEKAATLGAAQVRHSFCKISQVKLVLILIVCGTFFALLHSPSIYNTERPANFEPRQSYAGKSFRDGRVDQGYTSHRDINWDGISNVLENLAGRFEYRGIGLLNFNDSEIDQWKQLIPDAESVLLHVDSVADNITWESLFPEWIDEEEEFEVPTCPYLPWITVPGKPRLDLIAVKLPCEKSRKWTRDVVHLHLQLAVARLAALSKGYHPVRVLLVTECFPIQNLFTCKELVAREGGAWLYEPNLNVLREKVRLPVGSCELSVPLKAKGSFYTSSGRREAYATILHSAQFYVCGAIAAAQSIRMSGSTRDRVILVDDTISEYHRGGLEAAGWKVHTIERIRNPKAKKDAYNEWNYSKFRLWQLTDYDKIIFIDADLLILRNIDFLFEMPQVSATGNDATLFNSGVMVVEPSNCTFELLMEHIDEVVSYNGGDQGYLNEIFTWWHRIPKHMNFLKHYWEGDEEEKKAVKTRLFGADPPVLYVLHYLGVKPWLCFRDYDCNWNVRALQKFASDAAHRRWWQVHDAMPQNLQKFCLLTSVQKATLEWDRRQAEKGNYTDRHWKIKVRDKRLKRCFEKFCFWESMLWHWGDANWTDNAAAARSGRPPAIRPS